MYKEAWEPKTNKTEISVVQMLTVVLTVLVVFILPAQLITLSKGMNNQSPYTPTALEQRNQSADSTAKVAGIASDAKDKRMLQIPFTNVEIDLNSETGLLIIAGLILLGLSVILAIYLLLT